MVRVSVILTVYNNKCDIMNAIQSVLEQSFTDWELIIINDGSTDGLYEVIRDTIDRNSKKIFYYENATNIGRYPSLNEGIIRAKGEFVCVIDSDDRYHPHKLDTQIKYLNKYKDKAGVLTHHLRGERATEGVVTIMFRKNIIQKIGYYDSVRFAADSEYIARIRKYYGRKNLPVLPIVMYYIKTRSDSLTKINIKGADGANQKNIRIKYIAAYTEWHNKQRELFMPYPLLDRPFPIDPAMTLCPY